MPLSHIFRSFLLLVAATACAAPRPPQAPSPQSGSAPSGAPVAMSGAPRFDTPPSVSRPALPVIPKVTGPLAIRVQYPRPGASVSARDSNFIFGVVGSGEATLRINGDSVYVWPNGAFLGWLPVPPANPTTGTAAKYELVATLGPDTVRSTHAVRVPGPRFVMPDTGKLVVDLGSVAPAASTKLSLRANEPVRVVVRAPANAIVQLRLADSTVRPLISNAARGGALLGGAGTTWQTEIPASRLTTKGQLVVTRGRDTVRAVVGPVAVADSSEPAFVMVVPSSAEGIAADSEKTVVARPVPGGTYRWFLLPGTILRATGRSGGMVRVRFDSALEAWVDADDVQALPAGAVAPVRVTSNARVVNAEGSVDLIIPTGERPAYFVESQGDRLVLTLYGTTGNSDIIGQRGGTDDVLESVTVEPVATDRVRYILQLKRPVFGWQVAWSNGGFTLRVRRPPVVRLEAPLAGLTIAVDAGHPPIGSTGPTGLYEPVPTLAISERLKALLEARGATVYMTRTDAAPVALGARPIMARRSNAHAFVSVHLNALPDGTNPFSPRFGSGTYWFYGPSAPLAQQVQRALVAQLGLPDEGTFFDNLAVARNAWMPSILCEGAYIMFPDHEAALRTPEFQEAYARGIANGLEAYFRAMAVSQQRAPE